MHRDRNAKQQVAVERRLVEDFVHMIAGAADLTCQPAHAALVGFQLIVNEVPDVDVAAAFHTPDVRASALFLIGKEKA